MVKRKAKDAVSCQPNQASDSRQARPSDVISVTIEEDDDFDPVPKRPLKRVRKAQPRANPSTDDLEEGRVLSGAQKPATTVEQHLMEQNKKSKEFIQRFKEEAIQGRDATREALERFKQDLDKAHSAQRQELVGSYSALQAEGASSSKDLPLFRQTQHIIRLGRTVLERHQATEKQSLHPELASPREVWKQDEQKMTLLLEYGRHYGQKLAESLLSPDEKEPTITHSSNSNSLGDTKGLAAAMFDKTREAAEMETWGQAAHAQVKALAGVVRTLSGANTDG